jgi:DNA-binding LacI/PurR family transcriptional regulator
VTDDELTGGPGLAAGPVRPPAMSDVALLAGVSHQTVSRVLNSHVSVRPATRARVLEAIATLGYRPNSAARTLVTRRSRTFGVISPATTLYGPTGTLVGLEQAARDVEHMVLVAMLRRIDATTVHEAVEHLLSQGVDGLVMVTPTTEAIGVLAAVPSSLPVVVVSSGDLGQSAGHLYQVAVDQRGGARAATEHLLAGGRREVLHVAGPQDWFDARDRLDGWQDACRAAGTAADLLVQKGWSAQEGMQVGRLLVERGLPEAVFAANDQLALGLLHALWAAGVRVPDDVAVVGFDDEAGAEFYTPALSTVRQDLSALGRRAVDVLLAALAGEEPPEGLIPAELVVRASSLPKPTR